MYRMSLESIINYCFSRIFDLSCIVAGYPVSGPIWPLGAHWDLTPAQATSSWKFSEISMFARLSTFLRNHTDVHRSWACKPSLRITHLQSEVHCFFNLYRGIGLLASAKLPRACVPLLRPPLIHSLRASMSSKFILADLPDLPPAPRYPCPHLTNEDITQYVRPLVPHGWTIAVWDGPRGLKEPSEHVPELMKQFNFDSQAEGEVFAADAKEIWEKENVSQEDTYCVVSAFSY